MKPLNRNLSRLVLGLGFLAAALARAAGAATLADLDQCLAKQQWNEAAETAYEILAAKPVGTHDPETAQAKLKGAYALFKRGYLSSGLLLLRQLSAADWKSLPQGPDRFAEIVLLFQKKAPLSLLPGRLEQLRVVETSPYLQDEIRFAQGREAFDRKDGKEAKRLLGAVSKASRYYIESLYLLAAQAVREGDYKAASGYFSRIFEPEVMEQSSEFWNDIGTQLTSHWGTNLRVDLSADALAQAETVGQLSLLGLGRVAYATRDFKAAIGFYDRVPPGSRFKPRATLEKVWALLSMNEDSQAEAAARALAVDDKTFESLEARPLRALILVDGGRTDEARSELDDFEKADHQAREAIDLYSATRSVESLPAFLQTDLRNDSRLRLLLRYEEGLKKEIDAVRGEDQALYPVYPHLVSELVPLLEESEKLRGRFVSEAVARRLVDLQRLDYQARLIRVETYLEDREKLRAEFKKLAHPDEARQREHDRTLADLLARAVQGVDDLEKDGGKGSPALDFRQSELLWELSTARAVIEQSEGRTASDAPDPLRLRSLQIAKRIASEYPDFPRRADVLFFEGFAEVELGRASEGARTLREYVSRYPGHEHVPDAYRILGDIDFDANRFAAAETSFRKILQFEGSPVVGYALYKIGWCAYNEKSFARALLAFEKTVLWSMGDVHGSRSLNLMRESRHDLISVYAEVGDYRKAADYFGRFYSSSDKDGARAWLGDLAKALDALGQFDKSALIYRSLVELDPGAPDSVVYQALAVDGAFRLRQFSRELETMRKLVLIFKPRLAQPKPEGDPAAQAEAVLRGIVLAQVLEAKATDEKEVFDRVDEMSRLYLEAFGNWPSSEEPLYRYAQFLMRRDQDAAALEAFRTHWARFQATLKEPLREESLRNLISMLEKNEAAVKPAAAEPGPIAREILKDTEAYAAAYPKAKYARPIAYLRSTVLFKYHQTEPAISEAQKLFDDGPLDEIGRKSFNNIRVALYESKNWERTYRWAGSLLARKPSEMKPYTRDLKAIREESLFLLAEQTKDDAKAADYYLRLARDPDTTRLKEKGLYNAFTRLRAANRKTEALEAAAELEKADPSFDHLPEIAGSRAAMLQEAGDYERALPLLLEFLRRKDAAVSAESLQQARLNAALISEAEDKLGAASDLYHGYLKAGSPRTAGGSAEAERGLKRIAARLRRDAPAPPAWWQPLLRRKLAFEKSPLPRKGDLALRIKRGGETLETLAKEFADRAASNDTPEDLALESFCALPPMYGAYSAAIRGLGQGDAELARELEKVSSPLDGKAKEIAAQCLSKAAEAMHDGVLYRAVVLRWGWQADPSLSREVQATLRQLAGQVPRWDTASMEGDEASTIQAQLRGAESVDSWYGLAMRRRDRGQTGLARLTLVDALARFPKSGKLLNALAALEQRQGSAGPLELHELYRKATDQGSAAAWVNRAWLELSAGRIEEAEASLKGGAEAGSLAKSTDMDALIARAPASPGGKEAKDANKDANKD